MLKQRARRTPSIFVEPARMSFCNAPLCLVGEKVLPTTSRNWRSAGSLPLSAAIITSTEASIFSAAEAVVLFDRFLASSDRVAHLFTVRALDTRPVLRSSAVSATICGS